MTKLYNKKSSENFRRSLRKKMTPAEIVLWSMIRNKQVDGMRFLRQFSIGSYIVDFYCPERHLAIELDGEVHFDEESIRRDNERTNYLKSVGIRVLRFENFEVFEYPQRTIDEIKKYLFSDEQPENLVQR